MHGLVNLIDTSYFIYTYFIRQSQTANQYCSIPMSKSVEWQESSSNECLDGEGLRLAIVCDLLARTWARGRTLSTGELAVVLVLSATSRKVGAVAPHVQDRLELGVDHAQGGGEKSTLKDV
jgi:hypothetical protein